jgi:hypothetical protein
MAIKVIHPPRQSALVQQSQPVDAPFNGADGVVIGHGSGRNPSAFIM